jgi:hypothetical protein
MDLQNVTPEQFYVIWLSTGAFFSLVAIYFDD